MFEICPSSMCIICSFIKCNGRVTKILAPIRGKNVDPVLLLFALIGCTTTCRDCHCWLWVRSVRPMVSQRDLPNWFTASQCRAKKITTDVLLSRFAPYCIILTPFLELLNILSAMEHLCWGMRDRQWMCPTPDEHSGHDAMIVVSLSCLADTYY